MNKRCLFSILGFFGQGFVLTTLHNDGPQLLCITFMLGYLLAAVYNYEEKV